ncbi:MAG: HAMP domain-containing histidine kinase [Chamaesiphon sp.]|nr:HAMP domain-containing histidine kinase [Chamaesiphon sp.]
MSNQASFHRAHLLRIGLIIGLFMLVLTLELCTPVDYLFGYLYIAPILLASFRFGRTAAIYTTIIALILTLINLWIPDSQVITMAMVVDRSIASATLILTGWLSENNHSYRVAITKQQSQLDIQQQLVRLREDFASTLTHDLKTPLLGGIAALEAFQHENFGAVTAKQQQVLAMMLHSHQTSLQLVETLLDVYRNDTEGLQLFLAPVDLTALAEEVVSHLSPLAAADRIYLSINYGASDFRQSLWVNGDRFQLQRVFTNLLKNAIDHSRRGERVEIVLESHADQQVVKILDAGSGITTAELPHLFQRFYQGHSDRQAKGTGLGLYLCRQIIEAHHGIIWADNRNAVGAVFGFKLPIGTYRI